MTRVARYKIGYVVALVGLAVLCLAVLSLAGRSRLVVGAMVVVLLIPGRVQGMLFRDSFRGRRELDQGNPADALRYLERFLVTLRAQPWRRAALWLSWSFYTTDVEAMALNNIGSAHWALGAADDAVAAWRKALELDPLYPIPHANLALAAAASGDPAAAETLLNTAKSLGYSGNALDQTVHEMQSLLASVESRGPAV